MDAINIDSLKLYFMRPLKINEFLTVYQPTIGQLIDFGADRYYQVLNALTVTPEKMISILWDMGIDWEEITDFELFIMMTRDLTAEDTSIFLKDVDLSKMVVCENNLNGKMVLASVDENGQLLEDGLIIDELIHAQIAEFLRKMHNIKVQKKHAANKRTKKLMIQMDRSERAVSERESHDQNWSDSFLNMVSFALNCPGFKYKREELEKCGIVEFYDSIQRLNIIFQTDALLKGVCGGMVSSKDIPKENLNYMRSITQDT